MKSIYKVLNFFHNTEFRKINDQLNQPDYLYETDIYNHSIQFQYAQERKKRKKRDLQYHNDHSLKFTFPVCILGCYPCM